MRRGLATAFAGALESAEREGQDRFSRIIIPSAGMADPLCGYVFLILAYPKFDLKEGYGQYRKTRVAMLESYCASVLYDHREFKRMVGIALDASSRVTGREGGSEDLVAVEIENWTRELEETVSEQRKQFDVLQAERLRKSLLDVREFPDQDGDVMAMSRQQKRANSRSLKKIVRRR